MSNDAFNQAVGLAKKLKKQQTEESNWSETILTWILAGAIFLAIFLFLFVPAIIYFVWAHVFVLVKLWAWFIVPVFHLAPLTWAQAWGVSMIVFFLTHVSFTWKAKDERETNEKITEIVLLILKPWITLGVGWVCAHFFLHLF